MTQKMSFKISGMHCTSCAMNIDGELEDTDGVREACTSYVKGVTEVVFEDDKLNLKKILTIIEKVGYTAHLIEK